MNKTKKKRTGKIANLKIRPCKKVKSRNKAHHLIKSRLNPACITYSYSSFLHTFRNDLVSGFIAGDTSPEMEYTSFIGITEHIEIVKLEKNISGSKSLFVNFVMMVKVFKDDGDSFNTKSQYKGADMDSFEMAHLSPEVLEMFNRSSIHTSELCNFLLQSNEQDRILMPDLLHNLLDICGVYSHKDLHHLLNSSTVMDLPGGFLSIFFNFSIYSFFIGNSSTGCQSISSQNFSSSLDNCLYLINSSNNLLLFDSSLATSDQFTQGKTSNLSLNLSSIGIIKLTIYNTPLACNFSNTSSLFLIPSFITSDQLMSGCLSNFSLNSLDTDIVNLFIINTPHNCVSKHKCVDIFKPFGFNENNLTSIMVVPELK